MESLPEQEDKNPKAAIVNKPVKQPENPFKKPILFGKIGRLPKKLSPKEAESIDTSEINSTVSDKIGDTIKYEPNVQPNCLKGRVGSVVFIQINKSSLVVSATQSTIYVSENNFYYLVSIL